MTKKLLIFILISAVFSVTAFAKVSDIEKYAKEIADGTAVSDTNFVSKGSETAKEVLQPKNIFLFMIETISETFNGSRDGLITILAIIFLSAFISVFGKSLGSYSAIFDYVTLLSLMLVCFNMITPLILSVTNYLERHTAFMMSLSTTSSLLLASSGAAGSAAVASASSGFITAFTEMCAVNVILPAVKIIIVLSSASAISKSINLSGVIGFLKSFCSYGIGLLFAVFLAVHSLTINITSSADSLAFRSIRFTASRLIPVAGSMISESIRTVLAGINVIKSSVGGIGIAYIIYTAIPTVFMILWAKAVILTSLLISKIFGVQKHTEFLDGLNGAFNLLFAICIFASFGGIIILAVFMNTTINV